MSSVADQQKITIYEVADDIRETSQDEREKGDRFERVITVPMKTLEIVSALPKLNEREQPENWPEALSVDPDASR